MGMAASQARLLSITARMSDNEQSGQALSYAKERLADRTDQVTKEYNEALKATKLQIMTGYADGAASYSDISFAMLTSPQVVSSLGRQYCVTDTKGRVLVDQDVATAFENAKGSLNAFLGALGVNQGGQYSLSDINPSKKTSRDSATDLAQDGEIVEQIHEAWDRYFNSVGKTYEKTQVIDNENVVIDDHGWDFKFFETDADGDGQSGIGEGYATITVGGKTEVLNFEGTSQEQLDLYNYAMAITESYYSVGEGKGVNGQNLPQHNFENINTQYNKGNSSMLSYYTNLYNKMLTSGYYSYTSQLDKANKSEHWVYDQDLYRKGINDTQQNNTNADKTNGTPLEDSNTFEQYLMNGTLLIQVYSKSEGKFVSTSISEDTCIQEVEDETQIAIAESKYQDDLAQIERLDSRYDLQMKRLDTEHNTLQTEYESVKNVIKKNVENSFQTFG